MDNIFLSLRGDFPINDPDALIVNSETGNVAILTSSSKSAEELRCPFFHSSVLNIASFFDDEF